MFAVCIESSHKRGMGHLFRAIQLVYYLKERKEKYIILLNEDEVSKQILNDLEFNYRIVSLDDYDSNWEKKMIDEFQVTVWFNDRMDTDIRHSRHIKKEDVQLITMDDHGLGAELADINFGGMSFKDELKGKEVFYGKEYLILNKEIYLYRRVRTELNKIIVSLGGSDTYGVTINIIKILKAINKSATILIGPNFIHHKELNEMIDERFKVIYNVPSLIKEFDKYDLAITGGGVTCFEANAMGLPCLVIANELHEITIGQYLEGLGGAMFLGYYKSINEEVFNKVFNDTLNIQEMSKRAMQQISLNGVKNIYDLIKKGERR